MPRFVTHRFVPQRTAAEWRRYFAAELQRLRALTLATYGPYLGSDAVHLLVAGQHQAPLTAEGARVLLAGLPDGAGSDAVVDTWFSAPEEARVLDGDWAEYWQRVWSGRDRERAGR